MKHIFDIAVRNPLWAGISYDDFIKFLKCSGANTRNYGKGEIVLLAGDAVNSIGLILSGRVKVIKEDIDGKISILNELGQSELFNEVTITAGFEHSPVTIQALEKTEVLSVTYKKLITVCSACCNSHLQLIENLLKIVAKRFLKLDQKVEVISKHTIRERLFVFFDLHRGMSKQFTVPYSREEMAHYLCVDRSAMSNELSKMQAEGLIAFHKNKFEILANYNA